VLWSVVEWSVVKCSEVLQCSDVLLVLSFLSLCIWLYVLYTFVSFCKLCILIFMFVYYYYVCSAVYILFSFRLPWLRVFRAFSSFVRSMPGYTVRSLTEEVIVLFYVLFWIVLFYVLFLSIVLFHVLSACKCVLYYYYHQVSTQLQLKIHHISNWSRHVANIADVTLLSSQASGGCLFIPIRNFHTFTKGCTR
jgi:hypothetical protein